MTQNERVVRATVMLVAVAMIATLLALSPLSANADDGLVLTFTTQPDNASGGTPFGTQPVVTVQDTDGQTVDVATSITLSLVGGGAGVLRECDPVDTVAGVAVFAGCTVDLAGTGYRLEATATGITTATSDAFDVVVGEPVAIRFATQPTDVVTGEPFAPAPAVELRDAGDNPAVPDGFSLGAIAVTSEEAPVPLTGCTGGREVVDEGATFYSVDPAADETVATFSGCGVAQAGTDFTLLAVAVPDDDSVDALIGYSDSFDVSGGEPAQIVFRQQPGGATSGQALTRQPVLALVDASGNTVPGPPGLEVELDLLPVDDGNPRTSVELHCPGANRQFFDVGVAEFESCSVDNEESSFFGGSSLVPLPESDLVLRASAGAFVVESAPFGPGARSTGSGAVDHLGFTTQPGDGTGGTALATQPVVEVLDESGVGVAASVELTLVGGPVGANLRCPNTTAPAPRGVATYNGCAVDQVGTYRLVATEPVSETTVESAPFEITVGEAAQLAFAGNPTEAIAGTPFSAAVEIRDAGGNVVPTSGAAVRLALAAGTGSGGGRLECAEHNSATIASGAATFGDCAIDRPGSYRLISTGAVGVAITEEFSVLLGPPAAVEFLSAPESAIAGGTLATPRVLVEDAGGNPLDATVSLRVSGGSLSGCDLDVVATLGIAAFPGCVLGASGQQISLDASAGSASASVGVPVSHEVPVGSSDVAIPLAQTFGGNAYANNPSFVTNDVNGATGALQFASDDITVAGIGIPFALTRTYNSADDAGGLFGPGWTSVFDAGVTFGPDGSATVRGEDGQRLVFAKDPTCRRKCELVPPAGATSTLACKKQTCTVTRFDGVSFTSTNGRIERFVARTGHGLSFQYDRRGDLTGVAVTSSDGPLAIDVSTADGRITGLETPTRSLAYGYTDGALTSFADPNGNTTTYDHDGTGLLTGRQLGSERLTVSYRSDGRVAAAATTGQQRRYTDTYDWSADGAGSVAATRRSAVEAHGQLADAVHVERYQDNVLVSEQLPSGATQWYSFDGNANLVGFQDALGGVQRLTYSPAGDPLTSTTSDGGTTSFTYDGEHRRTSITDPLGNTTAFHYADTNLQKVTPPDPADPSNQPGATGKVGTIVSYDDFDLPVHVTSPTGVRTFTYDRFGNQTGFQVFDRSDVELLSPLNGMGPLRTFDEAGNVVSSVDPRGRRADGSVDPDFETTYSFDPSGRVLQASGPAGDETTTTYSPAGEVTSITNPLGTTSYAWDESTRTRTATGASTGSWTFDPSGSLLTRTDAAGRTTTAVHDVSGLVVAEIDAAGVTARQYHDMAGDVVRVVDELGVLDVDHQFGRSIRTVVNGRIATTTDYDRSGNVVSFTEDGQETTYTYDNHGLLSSVTDGAGTTSYTYDGDENLASVTDGNGNTTAYTNNGAGQRIAKILGTSTWTYEYDVDGNLATTVDPDGRSTTYGLDTAGRRTGITHSQSGQPTIEIAQSFDALGQRVSMTDPTGTHSFGYDDGGNLTSVASPTGTFSYDYSDPGKRTDTYPDGTTVTYGYDDAQRLMTLDAPGVSVAYTRDSSRRLTGIATGNGLFETFGYDADGQLVSQELRCGADAVMTNRYGYGADSAPLGAQRSVAGQTVVAGYGYDGTDRLVAEDLELTGDPTLPGDDCTAAGPVPEVVPGDPEGPTLPPAVNDPLPVPGLEGLTPATDNPITYDAVGNRTTADGVSFTYDGADRLVSGSDGRSATYDGAGNLTSSTTAGDTTTYGYDAAGKLSVVTLPDGRTVSYTHDGDGMRVGKSVDGAQPTTYAWDRSADLALLALEVDPSGDFRRYFYGVGPVALQTQDGTFYLHADRRGDVIAVTDAAGAIVASYAYDAFGSSTESTSPTAPDNALRFAGQYLDEDTGLYHLRARDYDPSIGRFTQRDPVTPPIGVSVVSPYVYADNQPTVLADASGQTALPIRYVGHSTEAATTAEATKVGVAGGRFLGTKVLPKVLMLKKLFPTLQKMAGGSATGALNAVDDTAKVASKAGKFLAVAGIALSAYLVYEDCTNGSTAQCVGASISLAFNIGCLAVSGGAATILCSVAGIGLSYVATNYGPDIAEFTKDTYNSNNAFNAAFGAAIGVVVTTACIVATLGTGTGFCVVAGIGLAALLAATVDFEQGFIDFGGAIASGFNDLGSSIVSGFDAAGRTILQAGVEIDKLIALLKDTFSQTGAEVVAYLVDFGLDVVDIANDVAGFFTSNAALAIEMFRDLGYDVAAVAEIVDAAFDDLADWSGETLAQALALADYGLDEVLQGLQSAFDATAEEFTAIGRALNYTVNQIAGGLVQGYAVTAAGFAALADAIGFTAGEIAAGLSGAYEASAAAVVSTLQSLGVAAEVIGAAVEGAFVGAVGWSRQALADAFDAAGFTASQIARGFQGAYDATAAEVAGVLDGLGFAVNEVSAALQSAYSTSVAEITEILHDLGVAVTLIADALVQVYGQSAAAVRAALGAVGAALDELGDFFGDLGNDIADTLNPANWV